MDAARECLPNAAARLAAGNSHKMFKQAKVNLLFAQKYSEQKNILKILFIVIFIIRVWKDFFYSSVLTSFNKLREGERCLACPLTWRPRCSGPPEYKSQKLPTRSIYFIKVTDADTTV
jgi:hypothetical protein